MNSIVHEESRSDVMRSAVESAVSAIPPDPAHHTASRIPLLVASHPAVLPRSPTLVTG